MRSGNNTPKPPDPMKVAAAQTGSNQQTALYETMLNMQNQITPQGTLSWSQNGTWNYTDPVTKKTMTVPRFTATQQLSPEEAALYRQQQQFDARYNQMAIDQATRVKDTLSKPFEYNPGAHEKWAGGIYDDLNRDNIRLGEDELRASLNNRGLNIGTEAYDRAMRDFYEGNQRARSGFMLDSYGTGLNTALTMRNQPLKEGITLMGGGQISEPSWISGPQSGVGMTDVAGIYGQNYNQQLARSQAQNAQSAGLWGALGQLGGAALGGWMASDKRAKKGLQRLGKDAESGLPVSRWTYKGGEMEHETPLAQDVEKKYPGAVEDEGGVKMVNWRAIPGGEKFERDTSSDDPRLYSGSRMRTDLPNGEMLRGQRMRNPGDDPSWSIKKALPAPKEQEARHRRRGLSRLGERSVA